MDNISILNILNIWFIILMSTESYNRTDVEKLRRIELKDEASPSSPISGLVTGD